jgi:hypothetical protein
MFFLAVDFDDFYRQHSFGFHTFGTILLWFSLTLTSSISFGEYLNSGATYMKLSQNGENPRPAGRPMPGRPAYHCEIWSYSCVVHDLEHKNKPTQGWFRQNSQVEIERLEPSQDGLNSNNKPKNQDPNRLKEQCASCEQRANATEARTKPEPGRSA